MRGKSPRVVVKLAVSRAVLIYIANLIPTSWDADSEYAFHNEKMFSVVVSRFFSDRGMIKCY